MKRTVEIRTLTLKAGARAEFQKLWDEEVFLLNKQFGTDVVFYGPSSHDADTFCVIRTYDSLEQRQHSQEMYYSSPEWVRGPRAQIVALIKSEVDAVLELDAEVVEVLRHSLERGTLNP